MLWTRPHERHPMTAGRARCTTQVLRRATGGPFGVVVATLATVMLVASGKSLSNPAHVALMALPCTAYLLVITRPGGAPLSIRLVSLAVVVQTAVALAVRPSATEDLWWYAIYGRILAVYHAQPLHARRCVVPA